MKLPCLPGHGSTVKGHEHYEPAIRIERTTCGLRISDSSTSDNLTPQETTKQGTADLGPDGAGLSCPSSSVVADAYEKAENDGSSFPPLA